MKLKNDKIFALQAKYVKEVLRKIGLSKAKRMFTPMHP